MQLWPVEMVMTIACLGWGSLIWRNDGLRCDGNWQADGPLLPIEFARMSRGGEVTLVILDGVPAVPVLWSVMEVPTLAAAAENLRIREGRTRREWIGTWSRDGGSTAPHHEAVAAWARPRGFSGVVWTALPPKWGEEVGRVPSLPEILAYLSTLEPAKQSNARKYILETPQQITTTLRPTLTAWAGP